MSVISVIVLLYASNALLGTTLTVAGGLAVLLFTAVWQRGMRVRQKVQIGTWSAPSEGPIHCKVSLDASKMLAWLRANSTPERKITLTAAVGKVVAEAIGEAPSLCGRILLDRFVPHPSIGVSFLVSVEGGKNLAKVKVEDADRKDVFQFADELSSGAGKVRKGKDENFNKSMGPLKLLPTWAVRMTLHSIGWLAAVLGVSCPPLGVEAFPFGTCCVTSVGMFGVQEAYAPFTPFTHVPVLVLVGEVHDGAMVVDGVVQVRPKVKLMCTIDHRFVDGAQSKKMMEMIRRIFENPELLTQESVRQHLKGE